jgi:uncharacterized protein YoxC
VIKEFYNNHQEHAWLEDHLLYLALVGFAIIFVICIILLIKTSRKTNQIIKNSNEKQKIDDKELAKYLSNKKNKV